MLPDQTALVLFHREVLLPEIKRAVDEAVAPMRRRLDGIEKQMKRVEQRLDVSPSLLGRVSEQVDILDLKLEMLESLWDVTKAIGDAVGAKVPWRKPVETSTEGVT
jgi:hypothetical protein